MCSDNFIVDLSFRLRESTVAHQSWVFFVVFDEGEEVIQMCYFTEVRANGIQENELKLNVSFDEIDSRFVVNVD